MKAFRDLPVGAQFTQLVCGVRLSRPIVMTKVEEYVRGTYSKVNAHYHAVDGRLCRAYIYAHEEVEEAHP